MILRLENPKKLTKKLLERINEFSKFQDTINIQKPIVCLYTCNKLLKNKIKKSITFIMNKIFTDKFNKRSAKLIL